MSREETGIEEVCKRLRLPTLARSYRRILQRYETDLSQQRRLEEILTALLWSEQEGREIKARVKTDTGSAVSSIETF